MIDRIEKEVDMLDRHLTVLRTVIEEGPIGIEKISDATEYAQHKVRYSLRVLEEEDLVEPSAQGATTTDQTADYISDLDNRFDEMIAELEDIRVDPTEIDTATDD